MKAHRGKKPCTSTPKEQADIIKDLCSGRRAQKGSIIVSPGLSRPDTVLMSTCIISFNLHDVLAVGTIIAFILQMGKLRFRESMQLAQDPKAASSDSQLDAALYGK